MLCSGAMITDFDFLSIKMHYTTYSYFLLYSVMTVSKIMLKIPTIHFCLFDIWKVAHPLFFFCCSLKNKRKSSNEPVQQLTAVNYFPQWKQSGELLIDPTREMYLWWWTTCTFPQYGKKQLPRSSQENCAGRSLRPFSWCTTVIISKFDP